MSTETLMLRDIKLLEDEIHRLKEFEKLTHELHLDEVAKLRSELEAERGKVKGFIELIDAVQMLGNGDIKLNNVSGKSWFKTRNELRRTE